VDTIATHVPDIAVSVLRKANCSLALSFACPVNHKGLVSMLGADFLNPAPAYAPYLTPLTSRLNKVFLVGNSPWEQFKPTPNEAQLTIDSLPLDILTSQDGHLFPTLDKSIHNARGISIITGHYQNPNPESRAQKGFTLVVVTLALSNADKLLLSIYMYSRNTKV